MDSHFGFTGIAEYRIGFQFVVHYATFRCIHWCLTVQDTTEFLRVTSDAILSQILKYGLAHFIPCTYR